MSKCAAVMIMDFGINLTEKHTQTKHCALLAPGFKSRIKFLWGFPSSALLFFILFIIFNKSKQKDDSYWWVEFPSLKYRKIGEARVLSSIQILFSNSTSRLYWSNNYFNSANSRFLLESSVKWYDPLKRDIIPITTI